MNTQTALMLTMQMIALSALAVVLLSLAVSTILGALQTTVHEDPMHVLAGRWALPSRAPRSLGHVDARMHLSALESRLRGPANRALRC